RLQFGMAHRLAPAINRLRHRSGLAVGPLAISFTWLQAGRPNHHGGWQFHRSIVVPRQSQACLPWCFQLRRKTSKDLARIGGLPVRSGILPDNEIAGLAARGALKVESPLDADQIQ